MCADSGTPTKQPTASPTRTQHRHFVPLHTISTENNLPRSSLSFLLSSFGKTTLTLTTILETTYRLLVDFLDSEGKCRVRKRKHLSVQVMPTKLRVKCDRGRRRELTSRQRVRRGMSYGRERCVDDIVMLFDARNMKLMKMETKENTTKVSCSFE